MDDRVVENDFDGSQNNDKYRPPNQLHAENQPIKSDREIPAEMLNV